MRSLHLRLPVFMVSPLMGLLLLSSNSVEARGAVNRCPVPLSAPTSANLIVTAPILDYTITNFDANWFNTSTSNHSAPLFTIQTQGLDARYAGKVRLWVQILADTSLSSTHNSPSSAYPLTVFDRITDSLTAAEIGVPLTSGQVFALPFQPGGIAFENSDLRAIINDEQKIPQMNLMLRFALTCEDGGVAAAAQLNIKFLDKAASLRQVTTIQALSPGTNISNPTPVTIFTQTPTFQIISPLIDSAAFTHPSGESNMEVLLYEVPNGLNPQDVFDGLEFAKFEVNASSTAYPSGQAQLVPGNVYAWRARGLLRGPTSDYIYSAPLYFQVDPRLAGGSATAVLYADEYSKRVMAALKIILGENYEILDLSRADKIPAKGQIRLNGRPYSLEDLERLAREFQQSSRGVTRLRFQ